MSTTPTIAEGLAADDRTVSDDDLDEAEAAEDEREWRRLTARAGAALAEMRKEDDLRGTEAAYASGRLLELAWARLNREARAAAVLDILLMPEVRAGGYFDDDNPLGEDAIGIVLCDVVDGWGDGSAGGGVVASAVGSVYGYHLARAEAAEAV